MLFPLPPLGRTAIHLAKCRLFCQAMHLVALAASPHLLAEVTLHWDPPPPAGGTRIPLAAGVDKIALLIALHWLRGKASCFHLKSAQDTGSYNSLPCFLFWSFIQFLFQSKHRGEKKLWKQESRYRYAPASAEDSSWYCMDT